MSKNVIQNLHFLNLDIISKFNLYVGGKLWEKINIDKINFLVILNMNETFFFKKILILSAIGSSWFSQKITILKIFSLKNHKKNLIFVRLGSEIRSKLLINNILFYINNIMKPISNRIDKGLHLNIFTKYYIYKFKNINYLLGLNTFQYNNSQIDYNIVIVHNINLSKIKRVRKFYEKIFFL